MDSLDGARVTVTGAGFIASRLVRRCLDSGATVQVLIRPDDSPWRLEDLADRVRVDRITTLGVAEPLRSFAPDLVFNLAGRIDNSQDLVSLSKLTEANVGWTADLVAALSGPDMKPKRLIHVGSIAEYGSAESPFREDRGVEPFSSYGLTKLQSTESVLFANRSRGLPAVVVRPALVYGPAQHPNMLVSGCVLAAFAGSEFAMSDGRQRRDFIFVDDLVSGLVLAATTPGVEGGVFNVGSGVGRSVRSVAETIWKKVGASPEKLLIGAKPARANDPDDFVLDSNKAASVLDFVPAYDFETGIAKTIEWYATHGDGLRARYAGRRK